MSHPKSSTTHVSVSLSDSLNSTSMAQTPLVHKSASVVNSSTKKVTSHSRNAGSTKNKYFSPRPRNFPTHGLVALNRNFKTRGFPKRVRK